MVGVLVATAEADLRPVTLRSGLCVAVYLAAGDERMAGQSGQVSIRFQEGRRGHTHDSRKQVTAYVF